jgi:hypothetical protein
MTATKSTIYPRSDFKPRDLAGMHSVGLQEGEAGARPPNGLGAALIALDQLHPAHAD